MAWRASSGRAVMPADVVRLMAEGAMHLRDIGVLHDNDPDDDPDDESTLGGSPSFDRLDQKSRVWAMAYVLRHLSDPELPEPGLTAWSEGIIWAIFLELQALVGEECSSSLETDYRCLISAACRSVGLEAMSPRIESRDTEAWIGCLLAIADEILWDRDFLDVEEIADLAPDSSATAKRFLRIDDAYFLSLPPVVREEDYRQADRCLRAMAGQSDPRHPRDDSVSAYRPGS